MSRTLEISDELYERIENAASVTGTTPTDWLDRHVPKTNGKPAPVAEGKTLRERLEGLIGNFASGDGQLSQNTGEKFTDYVEQKRREGRF
jgi:hypothetical protein